MIRTPSSQFEAYRWYRDALNSLTPSVHDGDPQPGWFKRRLVKQGPWVTVRIWLDQVIDPETGELSADELVCCEVDGIPADPRPIWTFLTPITRDEFNRIAAERQAGADPRQKINLMKKVSGPNG